MKKLFLLSAVLIAAFCTACDNEHDADENENGCKKQSVSSNTFINSYSNPGDAISYFIELKDYPFIDLGSNAHWSTEAYYIDKIGIICSTTSDTKIKNPLIFPTNECDEELFDKIAEDNRDSGYDNYYWDPAPYLFSSISEFNITCAKDYDATHPAGTPLNDMTEINYFTAEPFIESNYKDLPLGNYEKNRIVEPLDEFVSKRVNLVRFDMYLRLTREPQNAGLYQFTLSYRTSDGATLSTETVPIKLLAR